MSLLVLLNINPDASIQLVRPITSASRSRSDLDFALDNKLILAPVQTLSRSLVVEPQAAAGVPLTSIRGTASRALVAEPQASSSVPLVVVITATRDVPLVPSAGASVPLTSATNTLGRLLAPRIVILQRASIFFYSEARPILHYAPLRTKTFLAPTF
jgi:hypothetical protein